MGHDFTGLLTLQLAIATVHELFAPHPFHIHRYFKFVQVRARAILHRQTTTTPTYEPKDIIISHAIHQLALLGIYVLPRLRIEVVSLIEMGTVNF